VAAVVAEEVAAVAVAEAAAEAAALPYTPNIQ
jgi:hypothetical protein